jgi:hypothetical protein
MTIRVYIAGPYSSDPGANTHRAIMEAERLISGGFLPFVPHLSHFWHAVSPHCYEFWMQYDLAWLEACDCVLRFPGESAGADRECERAKELGIPVFTSYTEICRFEREREGS